jgi:hypothetical protein
MKWSWFPLQHKSIVSTVKLSKIMEQSAAQAYIPGETGTWDLTEYKSVLLPIAAPYFVSESKAWSLGSETTYRPCYNMINVEY